MSSPSIVELSQEEIERLVAFLVRSFGCRTELLKASDRSGCWTTVNRLLELAKDSEG